MKRIITMLLILCLCVGLSACGGNAEPFEAAKSTEAQKADELILAIGDVSLEEEAKILAAQAYYDTLTDVQKAEVEHNIVLELAIKELGELKKENEYKEIYLKALEYEELLAVADAYDEYMKLPSDYQDVAKKVEYLKPLVDLAGIWHCENNTVVSNKGEELGTPAKSYVFEISGITEEGVGSVTYYGIDNHSKYINSSIFRGFADFWDFIRDGRNWPINSQKNDDGSCTLMSKQSGKTGFGTLTTTFTITAEGKLAVEYKCDNDGDITSVIHVYIKE